MAARALMILGTGSHVGKSLLTTALCRIFAQHGIRVAPFKSQNMSLNSAATPEGLEIGRAQALQAEAAGIPPSVDMNPILIKPSGDMSSQVVVRGKIWGQLSASDYHLRRVHELLPIVSASYANLAATYELIVLEGAGSPAEINLKQHDIVNMRMAEMADAACLLVGDIDRGGVFASLLGTLLLLDDRERPRIRGLIVNKFRGDIHLLTPGLAMLEERTGKPCLGVVPWFPHLTLDEEDSLGMPEISTSPWQPDASAARALRIAVIALPSLSNFTDFDALRAETSVELHFVRDAAACAGADVIILPGSKQTADDLQWLRREGLAEAVLTHARDRPVIGICGGFQMLGRAIEDPCHVESANGVAGLALLPIRTIMQDAKRTVIARGWLAQPELFGQPAEGIAVSGYEIHVGETMYETGALPFAQIDTAWDGCVSANGKVWGTYLHGLFDDDAFRHIFVGSARADRGLRPPAQLSGWHAQREQALNEFAAHVEDSLDMSTIFGLAGFPYDAARRRRA